METEEAVKIQIDSSQWVCSEHDKLIKRYRRARTNKERAKLFPLLEAMKGRLMLEHRFIDKMIEENLGDEEEDRGF